MKKLIRITLVVLVLAAVGVGGYWFYQNKTVSAASTTSGTTYTQIVQVTQGQLGRDAQRCGPTGGGTKRLFGL